MQTNKGDKKMLYYVGTVEYFDNLINIKSEKGNVIINLTHPNGAIGSIPVFEDYNSAAAYADSLPGRPEIGMIETPEGK